MQALMLAAGMGCRLESTVNKCMVEIGGISLFERFIQALKNAGISKLIMVTGYRADELERFVARQADGVQVVFVRNKEYAATNNIWSLYAAAEYFSADDTILLESDLIYDMNLLRELVDFPFFNVAVVAKLKNWMDGTTVLLEDTRIVKVVSKQEFNQKDFDVSYKTVNIYKFSRDFLCQRYLPALKAYIKNFGKNQYYEMVLKELVGLPDVDLQAFILQDSWYEIDTPEDLQYAENVLGGNRRFICCQ